MPDDEPRWQQRTVPQSPRPRAASAAAPGDAAGDAQEQAAARPPGRFVMGEELGRGGMGCVVAATDTVLERAVAIKQALGGDADSLRRFEREAKITAQLEHPAIVPIHDAGTDEDGRPYYVMRRVEGEPLADRVARAPDVKARLALVPNVLAAVDAAAFAHARGLIHRDIKPWNILIGAYGETHLIDWGLARRIDDADADADDVGRAAGTPGYMSPEQALGTQLDARADVYALGATLLHVLTGEVMASCDTAWLAQVADGAEPPVDKIAPEVPRELVAIVGKAMAAAPVERYRDARELAADLRAFLAGQLVAAHRYSAGERVARFVRRHRVAVATAAAAVIAIAVIGALAIRGVVRERDLADEARATAVREQRLASDRAEVLLLDRASTLAPREPTHAVALLRGLPPSSPHLARARDIAAVAAARGVARGKTAHGGAITVLAIAPDGRRLLSAGQDGTLQVHDLETGASRTLVRGVQGILDAEWTHGGRTVTYESDRGLFVVEAAGGPPRAIDAAYTGGVTLELGSRDDRVRYLEAGGALIERAAEPGSAPTPLATGVRLFASRGERIVLASDDSLRLLDPTGARVLWRDPRVAYLASIAISLDGQRAVTASVDGVIEWDLATATEARRWQVTSSSAFFAGSRVYARNIEGGYRVDVLGSTRVSEVVPGDWAISWMTPVAAGLAMINVAGVLWILDESGELEVVQVGRGQHRIAGRAGSPYLAVASSGEIQWWDTRDLLPRTWTIERGAQLCGLDRERIYLGTSQGITVLPRDGGPHREIEGTHGPPHCSKGIGGSHLLIREQGPGFDVIDGAAGEARSVPGRWPVAHGESVFYVDGARRVSELAGGAPRPRWSGPAEIQLLAVGPTAVALGLAGDRLVRIDRRTGAEAAIDAPPAIEQIAVAGDGAVWLTIGAQLHRWGDAGIRRIATAPEPVRVVGFLADDTAVLRTGDNAGWTATAGGVLRRATEPARRIAFGEPRVAATMDLGATVSLTYLDSGERIVRYIRDALAIAADDRALAVVRGLTGERLELYPDPVPADPHKLHAWIDAATNAVVDPDRDALTWR